MLSYNQLVIKVNKLGRMYSTEVYFHSWRFQEFHNLDSFLRCALTIKCWSASQLKLSQKADNVDVKHVEDWKNLPTRA